MRGIRRRKAGPDIRGRGDFSFRRVRFLHQHDIHNLIGQLPIKSPWRAERDRRRAHRNGRLPRGSSSVAAVRFHFDLRFSRTQFQHTFIKDRSVSNSLQQRSVVVCVDAILPASSGCTKAP